MKIVVAEKIADAAMELLRSADTWRVVGPEEFKSDPESAVQDCDALIVRSAVRATVDMLQRANRLRVIGRAGVGVDNIDVDAATKRGIVVMNTPGSSAVSVAELTLGLMLCLARHLPRADSSTRAGKWEKKDLQGTELAGKTLGIVGLGRIGTEVARRAAAFKMRLIGSDPYVSPARADEFGIRLCTLDELYAEADYITVHVGLTHQTARMLNADAFARMKNGVRIINCARGELVDEAALAAAMQSGKVAGAALDVFTCEPPKNSPLLSLPNLVASPHIGASTREGQDATGVQIASQIRDFLRDGIAQNAVNLPSLTALEYEQLRPYMKAASHLGMFMAQLFASNLVEIELHYQGELATWKTDVVRASAVAGVLQYGSDEAVNLINAQSVAQLRGVAVRETHGDAKAKLNTVRLQLSGPAGAIRGIASVIHGEFARLLEFRGIEIESRLDGMFVVIENDDAPGVVGGIGTTLGRHGINIARLSLGRKAGRALSIVEVDSEVPAEALAELRQLRAIRSVTAVQVPNGS